MKSKAVKTMVIALLIIGVVNSLGLAQGRPGPRHMHSKGLHGRMGPGGPHGQGPGMEGPRRMLRQLDLTEEQQEKIKTIHQDNKEAAEAAREVVQNAMKALHEAVENEANEDAVHAAGAAVGQAMAKQALIRIKIHKAIKAELTEEQLKKWADLKEKVKERKEEFAEKGPRDFHGEHEQRHRSGRHRR